MERKHRNDNKYEGINALIRQIHGGSAGNIWRRQSHGDISDLERSTSDRSVNSMHRLPILEVNKALRKRSIFDAALKIPMLTVTSPNSDDTPDESHRRFSFSNFRRHSHSSVRINFRFSSMNLLLLK